MESGVKNIYTLMLDSQLSEQQKMESWSLNICAMVLGIEVIREPTDAKRRSKSICDKAR